MLRHILIVGIACLAGCQSVSGPFAPKSPERVDNPYLSISEQESRGRDRLALPDESPKVGPNTGAIFRWAR